MAGRAPLVGIPCDRRMMGPHPFHMVGEKYITALRDGAGVLPMLLPVLSPAIMPSEILSAVDGLFFTGSPSNVSPKLYGGTALREGVLPMLLPVLSPAIAPAEILSAVDGLFFTGSPSNVSPKLYGGAVPREGVLQDEHRDETTLPLLQEAIEMGKPVFCVCRGFQELNVALGGTLHQHIEELPGRIDHREDKTAPLDVQYGPAHEVTVHEGGMLARLLPERRFAINSLHAQGIDRLSPRLRVEAQAPDGTIEAVSMPDAKAFLLAVQWHPEWKWAENPVSRALFAAFGDAVQQRKS